MDIRQSGCNQQMQHHFSSTFCHGSHLQKTSQLDPNLEIKNYQNLVDLCMAATEYYAGQMLLVFNFFCSIINI